MVPTRDDEIEGRCSGDQSLEDCGKRGNKPIVDFISSDATGETEIPGGARFGVNNATPGELEKR